VPRRVGDHPRRRLVVGQPERVVGREGDDVLGVLGLRRLRVAAVDAAGDADGGQVEPALDFGPPTEDEVGGRAVEELDPVGRPLPLPKPTVETYRPGGRGRPRPSFKTRW